MRLRGTVVSLDAPSQFLVVQTGTDAVGVDTTKTAATFTFGRQIDIDGRTGLGSVSVLVVATATKDVGPGDIPPALSASLKDLASRLTSNRWVEAEGIVRSVVSENDGRQTFNIVAADGRFEARVSATPTEGEAFIDSRVRVRGVANTTFTVSGQPVRVRILVRELPAGGGARAPCGRSLLARRPIDRRPPSDSARRGSRSSSARAGRRQHAARWSPADHGRNRASDDQRRLAARRHPAAVSMSSAIRPWQGRLR